MGIRSAIGLDMCAAAGLYGDRASDITFSGKSIFTGMCVGGGATFGYLGDRDPPTLVLLYERPAAPVVDPASSMPVAFVAMGIRP